VKSGVWEGLLEVFHSKTGHRKKLKKDQGEEGGDEEHPFETGKARSANKREQVSNQKILPKKGKSKCGS